MERRIALMGLVVLLALSGSAHAQQASAQPAYDFPAIVVGSGYGGSIAAFHLSKAKVQTLVLERGRWWKVEDPKSNEPFPIAAEVLPKDLDAATPDGDPRAGWRRTVCAGNFYASFLAPNPCTATTGLLELVVPNKTGAGGGSLSDFSPDLTAHGIIAMVAAGVGGGSLVNNGVTFLPTKGTWDVAFPPADLPQMQDVWTDLQEGGFFDQAIGRLGPKTIPDNVLSSDYYAGTRAMYDFFGSLGFPELDADDPASAQGTHRAFAPVIVDWGAVRDEIRGRRVASVINGEAWWGINSGAKKSHDTDKGYLGKAIATGYTDVRALHTVSEITHDDQSGLYTVTAVRTNENYDELETLTFTTPNLIMSAGSLGTTKILVRARENGTLPLLNEHVGTRFSSNGNTSGFVILRSPADVAELGPLPQGGPAGVKALDLSDPANPVVFENLPYPQPGAFAQSAQNQIFLGAAFVVAVGVPTATGEFLYNSETDTVELHWPSDGALNVRQRFESVFGNFGSAFINIGNNSQAFTLHPLGGVPLGLATDMECQLDGYQGLYAVDGSIVPGSSGATNPSGLISSLAERCMKPIARKIARQIRRNN